MTFAILRELHAIIGDALDDIEAVYRESSSSSTTVDVPSTPCYRETTAPPSTPSFSTEHGYASPPPSPAMTSFPTTSLFSRPSTPTSTLDFPSLDAPYEAQSPAEMLTSHPMVSSAINRIVAAAGQMTMTVQMPFMSLSDASMAYHLPSCLRLVEASHTVEILRESGPDGLHVRTIAEKTGVEMSKMAHVLRLLATHHFLRETSPNVFATNRISSLMDTGKLVEDIYAHPEAKYRGTNGISAFVGMCTDELQKSSAYITEAYLLSSNKNVEEPTYAPFNFAFGCEGVGFFSWLEGSGIENGQVNGPGRDTSLLPGIKPSNVNSLANSNRYRLERFGTAMTGTDSWEVPGAVLNGFDWQLLPRGSIVVDVGGGIGSTSMFLAHAFSNPSDEDALGLRFIIQDRNVVVEMGEKAWREKCPELLDSGVAEFQVHDFFTPQPIRNAAVYFLRVILHDWPDDFARKILFLLREASGPQTKLVLADFILPLACTDDLSATEDEHSLADIIGVEKALASAPLLPNLGKASAHAYWMDLTMQATFNGQERTLREIITLTASAGWKVIKVTKAPGSLFGHIVAVPAPIPMQKMTWPVSQSALLEGGYRSRRTGSQESEQHLIERSNSRCGTPTLGSRTELPSFEESRTRFGGRFIRGIGRRVGLGGSKSGLSKLVSTPTQAKKKKPSPLSVSSPILISTSPRSSLSLSPLSATSYAASTHDLRMPPSSPLSPRHRKLSLSRQSSLAQLHTSSSIPIRQDYIPTPSQSLPSSVTTRQLSHYASQTQLTSSPIVSLNAPSSPVATRSRGLIPRRASLAQLNNQASPSSSTSSIPMPPMPDLPASFSTRSPFLRRKESSGPEPTDSPLPRKRSETLLGLPFKHTRNRSGSMFKGLQLPGTGRKITFERQDGQDLGGSVDGHAQAQKSGLLDAPARIEKAVRSKSRPASPF